MLYVSGTKVAPSYINAESGFHCLRSDYFSFKCASQFGSPGKVCKLKCVRGHVGNTWLGKILGLVIDIHVQLCACVFFCACVCDCEFIARMQCLLVP